MDNKRNHIRTPLPFEVKVIHESFGAKVLTIRDMSDGGLFIYTEGMPFPSLGTILEVQLQGTPHKAPFLRMEIVREESEGVGLRLHRP